MSVFLLGYYVKLEFYSLAACVLSAKELTKSELCSFGSIFRYTLNITELNAGCVESSKTMLSNEFWWIKFCRRSTESNNNAIDISLMSSFDENPKNNWSCESKANIKLLPSDSQKSKSIVKSVPNRKFHRSNSSHDIPDFIEWNAFLEDYVQNAEATFEIEIATGPLKREPLSDVEQTYQKFHIFLKNVSNLGEDWSPEVIVRGIKWRVHSQNINNFLSVSLQAAKNDLEMNWSYDVNCTFTLLTFKKNAKPLKYNFMSIFRRESSEFGFPEFLSWNTFVDKSSDYVHNDRAIILVEFKVEEPKSLLISAKVTRPKSQLPCSVCLEKCSIAGTFVSDCGHWIFCEQCYKTEVKGSQNWCWHCKKSIESAHQIYY